jgi:hypothetical protein
MTVLPPMDTDVGLMSPFTSPAMTAYGTLVSVSRGVISLSPAIVMPRYLVLPSKSPAVSGWTLPSSVEK